MKNRPATRNVKPGAFRSTRVVSGSAIAINAPLSSTTKIGTRIIRIPRTHRPPYICPSPGRSPERIAANPGEPFMRSAANVRGRDSCVRVPARNAGVFAVVGLVTGVLDASVVYALVVDGADPLHWIAQVPILAAVSATLVVTYTRLRRPHPVVVRIVVAAVVLLPFAFFLHDLAYATFVAGR